jgi:LuxR family maltose regulon positive regulatory protein
MAEKAKSFQPDENFVWSSLEFALGWAYRLSGDLESAYLAFIESSAISKDSGNIYMAVTTYCRAAYGQVLMGRLHQAEQTFQEAVNIASSIEGGQFPVAGYAYVYLGGIHYERNDLKAARRNALEGIHLCERVGFIMDQVVGYVFLSDYVYVQRWVEDCQVRLWIAEGKYEAISNWVQTSDLRINDTPDFKRDIDHIILARALVALGNRHPTRSYLDDALMLLSDLRELVDTASWNGKRIEILVLQAMALHTQGDLDEALNVLEKALMLAESERYVRTFVDEGHLMAELLHLAFAKGILPSYCKRLLVVLEPELEIGKDGEKAAKTSTLIEPLSKRELEVLKMLATDLSGPEIAGELSVALSTIRYHTNNIFGKLSVNSRRKAVLRANELNLL